jgi:hypothetical protein
MRDNGDVANLLPAALVFMQIAGGVCFVVWWALRSLVFGVAEDGPGHAGEPLRAPVARNADVGRAAARAAAPPVQRPRLEPARPAGAGQSSSGQQGGARPRRPTAATRSAVSARAQDDPRKRSRASSPPAPAARRRSEAERSTSNAGSAADDSRSTTSRDGSRPVRPAGAMEMPAARGDPAVDASSAVPPQRPSRRAEVPAEADSIQAVGRAVIAEYARRFSARQREGWDQNPRDPAAKPTPSALRAQRMCARANAGGSNPYT